MLKKLKLLLLYSKDYLFVSNLITILLFSILLFRGLGTITAIFWFKIMVSIIILISHKKRKEREIFFYMNNGVGERALLISLLSLDLSIYIIGITLIIYLIR